MKTFSTAERDHHADANLGPETIAVSERAKQQIGLQASDSKTKLQGPNFFEGFPDGPVSIQASSLNGVNVATVHWKL